MRKIYKLCIGIALSAIIVACADKLDSDKYFKDRRSLEDVFTDKENTEEWLAHAYSFLNGYNLEVSMMLNTITNFADDIYFGGNSLAVYKEFRLVLTMKAIGIRGVKVIKVFVKHLSLSSILI